MQPVQEPYPLVTKGKKIILFFLVGIIVVIFSPAAVPISKNFGPVAANKKSTSIDDDSQKAAKRAILSEEYHEESVPILYNKDHPIPPEEPPQLVSVGFNPARQEQFMAAKAGAAFLAMRADAAAEGLSLVPLSGYRNHQEQINIYSLKIQYYIAQGYSHEQAVRETLLYHSAPGTSEHEVGVAVDINTIEESFDHTPEFSWLQHNAASYGFILRYPKNKTNITHVAYEPWHYRYVGTNHATRITQRQLTLEEYLIG